MTFLGLIEGYTFGKVVDAVCAVGKTWAQHYYQEYYPIVKGKMNENINKFAHILRIKLKSDESTIIKEKADKQMVKPLFAMTLREAVVSAALTDDEEKHKILADIITDLIAGQMSSEKESIFEIVSRMACENIKNLTSKQLNILGLIKFIRMDVPSEREKYCLGDTEFAGWYSNLIHVSEKFFPLELIEEDLLHLESVSCVRRDSVVYADKTGLHASLRADKYGWNYNQFLEADSTGRKLKVLWEKGGVGLNLITLTTLGQLIGSYVKCEL